MLRMVAKPAHRGLYDPRCECRALPPHRAVSSFPDPYQVLGVAPDADPDAVSAAYRALARLHHPDVSRVPDAERRMAEINAAWSILRDPQRRAAYDLDHGLRTFRSENPIRTAHQRASAGGAAARDTAPRRAPAAANGLSGEGTWRRGPNGEGAAGPPPGAPTGAVLTFGRHIGWSLGEIARVDPGYLQWLAARPEGAAYRTEIDAILAPMLRAADGRGFAKSRGTTLPSRRRIGRR